MLKSKYTIVILASGRGSNAKALIEFAQANKELVRVAGVLSDRPNVGALTLAEDYSIPSFVVDATNDTELLATIKKLSPDWACLAGYKRLVSPAFLNYFKDPEGGFFRVLNVHPSLLPAYPGLNGYKRAWQDKLQETGVTVHLVDEGLDTGAPVLQEKFPIYPEDSFTDVEARGLKVEHRLFPKALKMALLGEFPNRGGRV